MKKCNTIIIFLLMLVSGLLIYYLYLKPEKFTIENFDPTPEESITCPQVNVSTLPNSVLSRYFGIGFNIYPASNNQQLSMSTQDNTNIFLIEHIPVIYNGTLGSMYAVSPDGQLTIKLRNSADPTQQWIINERKDTTGKYYVIMPYTYIGQTPQFALQYENGNLALRPFNEPGFESQKWILSNNKITRGVPVLNYSPASLFTPEFDPYSTSTNVNTNNISQQNNQQVNDVLNLVKTNIQQYLTTIGANQNKNLPQVSQSSLGNKEEPLNINVNLGSGASCPKSVSAFENITGTTTGSDILSLLNKYENSQSNNNNELVYTNMDLQTALQSNQGCRNINLSDYTSNRVASCNCKL